jgi:hypothetical protein
MFGAIGFLLKITSFSGSPFTRGLGGFPFREALPTGLGLLT